MPKVYYCDRCKKGYIFSTYQMIEHYNKYHDKQQDKKDEHKDKQKY